MILFATGLGNSYEVFRGLGISRPRTNCFMKISQLDKASEKAIIKDWLALEGGAKGDVSHWVHTIAKETHQWGQHITIYCQVAAKQIQKDNRILIEQRLQNVLKKGKKHRFEYYTNRKQGFDIEEMQIIRSLFSNANTHENLGKKTIIASFEKKYDRREAEDLFHRALEKGLLHLNEDDQYTIPIPSYEELDINKVSNQR